MAKSYARIDVLTATEANIGVVIRRGPRNKTQILTWDFATDTITPGQWVDSRIFSRRSDVSTDGKYLVFFMRGIIDLTCVPVKNSFSEYEDSCMVLCRPPYLYPLGLWATFGTYVGAGVWKDNHVFHALWKASFTRPLIAPPSHLHVIQKRMLSNPDQSIHHLILLARGWKCQNEKTRSKRLKDSTISLTSILKSLIFRRSMPLLDEFFESTNEDYTKVFSKGEIRYRYTYDQEFARVLDTDGVLRLELETKEHHPLWIELDQNERLVYAHRGCLWAWANFPKGKPQIVADLNGNTFEEVTIPDWASKP